jgi:hypothetical protein
MNSDKGVSLITRRYSCREKVDFYSCGLKISHDPTGDIQVGIDFPKTSVPRACRGPQALQFRRQFLDPPVTHLDTDTPGRQGNC